MAAHRVLVIYSRSLLAQAVESLLKRAKGLEVIGMDMDKQEVRERIPALHPEAVIVDRVDIPAPTSGLILELLRDNPSAKVLCLNMADSYVDIYSRRQLAVTKSEDLVRVLCRGRRRGGVGCIT